MTTAETTGRIYHLIFLPKCFTIHSLERIFKSLLDLLAITITVLIVISAAEETQHVVGIVAEIGFHFIKLFLKDSPICLHEFPSHFCSVLRQRAQLLLGA